MRKIKMISSLLIATLLAGNLSIAAQATTYEEVQVPLVTVDIQTSAEMLNMLSLENGQVEMKDTREVEWIDRIKDLPEEVRVFYETLEEATDNDGENDLLIKDQYFSQKNYIKADAVQISSKDLNEVLSFYYKYMIAAVGAFDRDHPEVFWLKGPYQMYAVSEGNNKWAPILIAYDIEENIDLRAKPYRGESLIKEGINEKDKYVEKIIEVVKDANDYEKIRYFNEVLTKTNEYNTSYDLNSIAPDCRSCMGALRGETGTSGPVCEGYARAFKVLCDKEEIPCVLVDGNANGGAHMWNYVKMKENWYAVDVTWNDPMVYGYTGAVSGFESEEWFLLGADTLTRFDETFSESHLETNSPFVGYSFINGPELHKTKYELGCANHSYGDWIIDKEADCTEAGSKHKECTVCGDQETEEIPAKDHSWADDYTVDKEASCTEKGSKSIHCLNCSATKEVTEIPKEDHSYGNWVIDKEAGCAEVGSKHKDCTVCGDKVTEMILAKDHSWDDEYTVDKEASCTEKGSKSIHCLNCSATKEVTEIPKEDHSYGNWVIDKEANCTEVGSKHKDCTVCGDKVTETILAKDHSWADDYTVDKEASCTEKGSKSIHCLNCSATKEVTEIPKENHSYGNWVIDKEANCTEVGSKHKDCTVCGDKVTETILAKDHSWDDEYTVDKEASCTEEGSKSIHCGNCSEVKDVTVIKKLDHNWLEWAVIIKPTSQSEGLKERRCSECNGTEQDIIEKTLPVANPFDDVGADDWYYNAVLWAVNEKITSGTSETTFSPDNVCTRAQVVTFLWNKAGQPRLQNVKLQFEDVKEGDWYYYAVLWAVENGITAGTSEATFSPNNVCTRAQVVTFLWNQAKQPVLADGTMVFEDVAKSDWYYNAVRWAVNEKITAGTSETTFSPNNVCTRAQVVTFLWNDEGQPIM